VRRGVAIGADVLCVVLALLGLALVVFFGPDSRRTSGPHALDTDEFAIVTSPGVLSWAGLRVDILAQLPVNKPVFVGLANSVDVEAYVAHARHLVVDSFDYPWSYRSTAVEGEQFLPGAPTALDWWHASNAGLGAARISTTLPGDTSSVAIMSVGSTNLSGLKVSIAWGIPGAFAKGIGLVLMGLGGWWLIRLVRRGARLRAARRSVAWHEVEETVFVWVDEFGIEHEVKPGDPDYAEFARLARADSTAGEDPS
jgi:hypothetical protein